MSYVVTTCFLCVAAGFCISLMIYWPKNVCSTNTAEMKTLRAFSFQYLSESVSLKTLGVWNHRVLHFYLKHSTYDELKGFYVQSVVLLCHISLSVFIPANCGAFCRLIKQSLKVTACFYLFFLLLISDSCMNSVCVRACVLRSNNCCCVCFSVKTCCVCLLRSTVRMLAAQYLFGTLFRDVGAAFKCSGYCRSSVQPVCSWVHIFLCNCFKTGAGEKHCKPGNDLGCSEILQTRSLFPILAYQISCLYLFPSQLQALKNTCLFLCCIGFVMSTSDWHRKSTISKPSRSQGLCYCLNLIKDLWFIHQAV